MLVIELVMVGLVTGSIGSIGCCVIFYDARLKVLHQLLPDSFTVRNKNGNPSGAGTVLGGHVNAVIQYDLMACSRDFKLGLRLIGMMYSGKLVAELNSFTLRPVPESSS